MDRILVGFDGSEHGKRVARSAGDLASRLRVPVTVLVAAEFVPGAYGLGMNRFADRIVNMASSNHTLGEVIGRCSRW